MPPLLPTVGSENPPLMVIRKFVYLLDQSDLDFQEELEVARLREEVVTKIRANQQLEKDLNLMDIKIGLLVKNRITLEVSGPWVPRLPAEKMHVYVRRRLGPGKHVGNFLQAVQSSFIIFVISYWLSCL